ncbi:hypothetical protein OIU85_005138 [Salix viminalis]|uniref:Uncharacterized protein n=1 Tax=Salix viminalis TaxID=40686 RepID=A0A9Q0SYW7_SALVM|nr:hypothetical protein OIU85_005138 [Salix viminalis]
MTARLNCYVNLPFQLLAEDLRVQILRFRAAWTLAMKASALRVDKGVGLHRIKGTFIIVGKQSFSCTHSIVVVGSIVTCSSRLSDLEQTAERESRTLPLLASTHVSRQCFVVVMRRELRLK